MEPNWQLLRDQFVLWLYFGLPTGLAMLAIFAIANGVRAWRDRRAKRRASAAIFADLLQATAPACAASPEQFAAEAKVGAETWARLVNEGALPEYERDFRRRNRASMQNAKDAATRREELVRLAESTGKLQDGVDSWAQPPEFKL